MKLAVIGFGNAGGKITDKLVWYQQAADRDLIRSAISVNSARVDLARLEHLPRENQILIGQTDDRVKGHGAGADPDLGAEITERDRHEIDRALDMVPMYEIDAFLVVAGLGGGTGSGGAPRIAEQINDRYDEPVYGLGVLPSKDEGGRTVLNAARSFQSFADATTNLILFDNDVWRGSGDSVEAGYERTNEEIARRIITLLGAGEIDSSNISEHAMDSSDIRRTLSGGGVSTIAYAESKEVIDSGGLLSSLRSNGTKPLDDPDWATKVNGLVRQAVQSRMTCPAEIDSAERSLIVLSGPPEALSRKGLESGRRWLEQQTDSVEVLSGDDPRPGAGSLAAVVLLANVTDVPPIDALQELGVKAKENIEAQRERREEQFEELVTDDDDALDPV
ncbi:tubulin/FtsZ family protein [Halovenus sp. HT40]|uniref:tubulin/FtsZ family protein n=1 Tax=Halovenus sp. HT40 TaxID=3126691 RepID=UPI00300E9DC8